MSRFRVPNFGKVHRMTPKLPRHVQGQRYTYGYGIYISEAQFYVRLIRSMMSRFRGYLHF